MKVSDIDKIIEEAINDQAKQTILKEMEENKKVVYHIKTKGGMPIATFASEEEAKENLPTIKTKHTGDLIIEKGVYESHDDMLDKLDEMNDQLETTYPMENSQMDEKLVGKQSKIDANHNGKIDAQDFKMLRKKKNVDEWDNYDIQTAPGAGIQDEEDETKEGNEFTGKLAAARASGAKEMKVGNKTFPVQKNEEEECHECGGNMGMEEEHGRMCECGGQIDEVKNICNECGKMYEHAQDGDPENVCPKCGKQVCECGMMNESKKKKTVRLTESELIKMIKNIVSESVPGLRAYKKAHDASGKENSDNISAVTKKMKDYLTFDGNDNPEFPKQIGKGEKMEFNNTKEEDEWVDKNRGRGMEDLQYDHEPSEGFKKRMKMAIEGDKLMGNESKDAGNVVQNKNTSKRILKAKEDKDKEIKDRVLYPKEPVPVAKPVEKKETSLNESGIKFSNLINEEIERMKKIQSYNKKTQ